MGKAFLLLLIVIFAVGLVDLLTSERRVKTPHVDHGCGHGCEDDTP